MVKRIICPKFVSEMEKQSPSTYSNFSCYCISASPRASGLDGGSPMCFLYSSAFQTKRVKRNNCSPPHKPISLKKSPLPYTQKVVIQSLPKCRPVEVQKDFNTTDRLQIEKSMRTVMNETCTECMGIDEFFFGGVGEMRTIIILQYLD